MRSPSGHPIVAAILDLTMKPMESVRERVLPLAHGRVLEIGVGTGMNAPFYDLSKIDELVGIEPDPHMLKRARPRFESLDVPTRLEACGAEAMPFEDDSFDTIVLTFTLCTIPDAEGAVREMYRVLKPGGVLHYAEHTRSDHAPMRAFQNALNPVWGMFSGGCNLNRDAVALLEAGGFELDDVHGHGRGPLTLAPIHRGIARKPVPAAD